LHILELDIPRLLLISYFGKDKVPDFLIPQFHVFAMIFCFNLINLLSHIKIGIISSLSWLRLLLHCRIVTLDVLADVLMVVGAVLVGYATCMLQQGIGPTFSSRTVYLFQPIKWRNRKFRSFILFKL
jgi:hypothetical protein